MIERQVAMCVFCAPEDARDAVAALKAAGFPPEVVRFLAPETDAASVQAVSKPEKAGAGAAAGALAAGLPGGLAGWLIGLSTVAIPGALVGMGIPHDEARYYEQEVRGGRSLVAVRDGGRAAEADQVMHCHAGYDVQHGLYAPSATTAAGW